MQTCRPMWGLFAVSVHLLKRGGRYNRGPTMLTVEDVAAVPLFSALPKAELERLARTSADLHLSMESSPFPRAESARCSPF